MRYGVWCLLMTLAMCAPSTTVGAQDADRAPTTEAHDAEARSLFEAGRLAFADARYADALAYFRRSFVLSHRPELLYNVGQAADRLRMDVVALDAFRRFLDSDPPAQVRREVEVRVAVLERQIAASATVPTAEEAAIRTEIGTDAPLTSVPTGAVRRDDVPAHSSDDTLVWGLAIGGGAAVVIAAIVMGVVVGTAPSRQAPLVGDVGGVVLALGGTW